MVARGEIGLLISSAAESQGVFSPALSAWNPPTRSSSDVFLVITWAITLCTIIGPVAVGLLVKRVKALERPAGASFLGVLGVP